MNKNDLVTETCLLLVRHFKNLVAHDGAGFHTRIFSHILHPEKEFLFIGSSKEALLEGNIHPEHVVPCAVLIGECCRLLNEGKDEVYIAGLLEKHWKIAHITKDQAERLDKKPINLKSTMPEGWRFESGNTLARLEKIGITELISG